MLGYLRGGINTKVGQFFYPDSSNRSERRWIGVFPDISVVPGLRSYHISEIPIVFGTYDEPSFPGKATANEIALSKYMQKAWVEFARDPVNGLSNYGWPQYEAQTKSLIQLGNFLNQTGIVLTQGAIGDITCTNSEAGALLVQILGAAARIQAIADAERKNNPLD